MSRLSPPSPNVLDAITTNLAGLLENKGVNTQEKWERRSRRT
jgi:hypothetical protein